MPTATKTEAKKVTITCKEPGCNYGPNGGPWQSSVPPNKVTQVLNMHRARLHDYHSTNSSTLRQLAVRKGEIEPQTSILRARAADEVIAEKVHDGIYKPGQRLVLSELAAEFSVGTSSIRQALWRLARSTPPLIRAKDGVFRVINETETAAAAAAVAKRRPGRPPGAVTHTEKIAAQLRSELGSKYPLGSRLPTGWQLGEEFSVSSQTANAAVRILEHEGWIDSNYKSRRVIALPSKADKPTPEPESTPEPEPEPPAHTRWDNVKEAFTGPERVTIFDYIVSQIQSGAYPVDGALPSQQVMANMAGVSRQAINEAYLKLVRIGFVEHTEEGWIVRRTEALPDTRTETKSERAERYLREGIESGKFPPDTLLPRRDAIARELGMSTAPIDDGIAALKKEGLLLSTHLGPVVLPVAERKPAPVQAVLVEQHPAPINADDDGEDEWFGLELLKNMLAATRRSWAAVDELTAKNKEMEARPNDTATVLSLQGDVARLGGKLREATEGLDKMRGIMHRQEEENANLRGELHRRKRNGFASFGADFRNNVGEALNLQPGELERIMQRPKER